MPRCCSFPLGLHNHIYTRRRWFGCVFPQHIPDLLCCCPMEAVSSFERSWRLKRKMIGLQQHSWSTLLHLCLRSYPPPSPLSFTSSPFSCSCKDGEEGLHAAFCMHCAFKVFFFLPLHLRVSLFVRVDSCMQRVRTRIPPSDDTHAHTYAHTHAYKYFFIWSHGWKKTIISDSKNIKWYINLAALHTVSPSQTHTHADQHVRNMTNCICVISCNHIV